MSPEQLEVVLKNSPLVLIILLILWQYRRDYTKVLKDSGSTTTQLIDLFERVIVALESNKTATKDNTEVINRFIQVYGQRISRK